MRAHIQKAIALALLLVFQSAQSFCMNHHCNFGNECSYLPRQSVTRFRNVPKLSFSTNRFSPKRHSVSSFALGAHDDRELQRFGVLRKLQSYCRSIIASSLMVFSVLFSFGVPVRAKSKVVESCSSQDGFTVVSKQQHGAVPAIVDDDIKVVARIEVMVEEDEGELSRLNQIGVALVALSALYILKPSGGNNSKRKRGSTDNATATDRYRQQKKKGTTMRDTSSKTQRLLRGDGDTNEEFEDSTEDFPSIATRNTVLGDANDGGDTGTRTSGRDTATGSLSEQLRKSRNELMPTPTPDELFSDDESIDDIFSTLEGEEEEGGDDDLPSSLGSASPSANGAEEEEEDDELASYMPPFASVIPAPETSRLSVDEETSSSAVTSPVPATTPADAEPAAPAAPAAAAPPAKKGILGRIFSKPGSGRPTEIKAAVKGDGKDDPTADYRSMVAAALTAYVPAGNALRSTVKNSIDTSVARPVLVTLDDDDDAMMMAGDADAAAASEEVRMQALKEIMDEQCISEQEAAEAFAEVTNALLTSLVDAAVQTIDDKSEEGETKTVEALDRVTDFIQGAGSLFGRTTPGAQIDPIQYNGKFRKRKLETLYYRYAKAGMDLTNIMSQLGGMFAEEGADGDADGPAAGAAAPPPMSPEERADRLGKVQFLFNIKEGKRNGVEQRIMRESMMGMAKGLTSGEGGDLGKMMETLTGGGSGGGGESMEELMAQLEAAGGGGGGFGGMPGGMEGMPDIDNMNPDEIAAMSKDAMSAVKQSLEEGSLTKQDVIEFEKMIGMDIKDMVGMMDSGRVDKRQLQKLSPDMAEMMDVFKRLAQIKG